MVFLRNIVFALLGSGMLVLSGFAPAGSESSPLEIFSTEICDNGVDDDNDGLIDAFDADCDCNSNRALLLNTGFELHDDCCRSITIDLGSCVQDWFSVSGSPDYYHVGCGIATDEPHMGIGQVAVAGGRFTDESLGQCLTSPLQVGKMYQFSIDVRASLGNTSNDLVLYGVANCDSLRAARSEQFCEIKDSFELIEMVRIESESLSTNPTGPLQFDYLCEQLICGILLGPSCDNVGPIAFNQSEYLHLDNISLMAKPNNWSFTEIIEVEGASCAASIELQIAENDSLSYQWYRNAIPIIQETQSTLTISAFNASDEYHVYVSNQRGCALVGPANVQTGEIVIEKVDSFCLGSSYDFRGKSYPAPGEYSERILTSGVCDSVFNLTLNLTDGFESYDTAQLNCQDAYIFGDMELGAPGDYVENYFSSAGCDSTVFLHLQSAVSDTTELIDSFCLGEEYVFGQLQIKRLGIYSDLLMTNEGCDSLVILTLNQRARASDTLVVDLAAGQTFDFMDESYDRTGIYEIEQEGVGGNCPSRLLLVIRPEVPLDYFIPNVIFPLSTNTNDVLVMHASEPLIIEEVRIFNRWGGQVSAISEALSPAQSAVVWDGMIAGDLAQPGVYLYRVQVIDAEGVRRGLAGEVTVIY